MVLSTDSESHSIPPARYGRRAVKLLMTRNMLEMGLKHVWGLCTYSNIIPSSIARTVFASLFDCVADQMCLEGDLVPTLSHQSDPAGC